MSILGLLSMDSHSLSGLSMCQVLYLSIQWPARKIKRVPCGWLCTGCCGAYHFGGDSLLILALLQHDCGRPSASWPAAAAAAYNLLTWSWVASVAGACSWFVLAVAEHCHGWHRLRAQAHEWSLQWLFPRGALMSGRSLEVASRTVREARACSSAEQVGRTWS